MVEMKDKKNIIGYVHSTESFGAVDGPGIRFIVFLQGCNMRCKYCHNPETWAVSENEGSIDHLRSCGIRVEIKTPEEILTQALRYKPYWKNGGGITVSGGEALLQIDFVTELFRLAKEAGVNTCLDTSGNPFTREGEFFEKFNRLCEVTDLFMLDIKQIDDEKHKELKGDDLYHQPGLVIGVPVGFVNVVAAKELIMESGLPFIVAKGRKGGSNVAAAIVNALMYQLTRR